MFAVGPAVRTTLGRTVTYSTVSNIQSMNSDKSRVLFYTDGSKIEFATSAVTFAPIISNRTNIIDKFTHFIEKDCLIKVFQHLAIVFWLVG